MKKTCTKCNLTKDIMHFSIKPPSLLKELAAENANPKNPLYYYAQCTVCKKDNQSRRNQIDKNIGYRNEYLKTHPCVDCGATTNLEFDHRDPTTKSFTIGHTRWIKHSLYVNEISKCEVRCNSCHIKRHGVPKKRRWLVLSACEKYIDGLYEDRDTANTKCVELMKKSPKLGWSSMKIIVS